MNHTMLSLGARAACVLLFAGATACTASGGPSDPSTTAEGVDELSVTFVTLRADLRACVAPSCAGYFVHDVNTQGAERYVSGLDFTGSGLPADAIDDVKSAPPSEIVLRGHFGPQEKRFHTQPFVVLDAFRGLPGVTPGDDAVFYQVHARKPPIACFVAPCPNEIASRLNTTIEEAFDRVSVDKAALPLVDKAWLTSRVDRNEAVAAGTLTQGAHFTGGFEEILEGSQVFVHLPERIGPCLARSTALCMKDTIAVYERTADRCVVQVACVTSGLCPANLPACPSGYTRTSWAAPPNGCPAFACDPSFILK